MKIDTANGLILKELLRDSRTSFTEIAKKIGITSTAVRNRYLSLKKLGIITGSTILINPRAFGYNCYGFLGIKTNQKSMNEVKDFLNKQPGVLFTWDKIEEMNIGNYFALNSLEDFAELIEEIRKNPHVKDIQPLIYVGSPHTQYPDKLIITSQIKAKENILKKIKTSKIEEVNLEASKTPDRGTTKLHKIDKTDLEIMRILSKNARSSFNGIGKKLSVSTVQVINRYEKLKDNKVIIGSSIIIDPQKIGYTANAMFYISLEIGTDTNKMYNKIKNMANAIVAVEVVGDCEIFAVIAIREFKKLFESEKQIRTMKGIKKVKINVNPPFSVWPINFFAQILQLDDYTLR
jgi:Lrp/AsnC family transcriptional regulator for asnA, asnC and gidA